MQGRKEERERERERKAKVSRVPGTATPATGADRRTARLRRAVEAGGTRRLRRAVETVETAGRGGRYETVEAGGRGVRAVDWRRDLGIAGYWLDCIEAGRNQRGKQKREKKKPKKENSFFLID